MRGRIVSLGRVRTHIVRKDRCLSLKIMLRCIIFLMNIKSRMKLVRLEDRILRPCTINSTISRMKMKTRSKSKQKGILDMNRTR